MNKNENNQYNRNKINQSIINKKKNNNNNNQI
jgi:hypothetical protein